MGNLLTSALDALATLWTRSCKIVIVGLDGAGKTALLYKLVRNETIETSPTIGANYEKFRYKNIEFTAIDFGGDRRILAILRVYLDRTVALIFVMDASDHDRIDEAAAALHEVLKNEALANAKLLIHTNKHDVAGCMSVEELRDKLNLAAIPNLSHIQKLLRSPVKAWLKVSNGFTRLLQTGDFTREY